MGQTLSYGVYLPNEGERNCYAGLASNWQILNTAVGNIAEKAPLVHTHGNITNDGKVGTTANQPLITGTGGVVQAGSFGNAANTFCEGNDSRLSDARTPLAHTHTKSDVTDLLNSNFIPSANNSYDLGSSSNQWNNLYAKNYYYNGVAWGLDKANVWTGDNVYSGDSLPTLKVKNTSLDISSLPASNLGIHIDYLDKNDVVVGGWNYIKGPDGTTRAYVELATKDSNNQEIRRSLRFDTDQNGANWQFYPSADINLGIASNQWKSVYAQTYYYNGTQWGLDKTNVWTGDNSYTGGVSLNSSSDVAEQFKQKLPKDVSTSNDTMARVNAVVDSAGHYVVVETLGHWSNYVAKNITLKYKNDSTKQGAVEFRLYSDGSGIFYPQSPFGCDLGNSYNKWKTLNGVNPGALSFPGTSYTDIKESITDRNYGANYYTAPGDGYVCVGSMASSLQISNDTLGFSTTGSTGQDGYASAYIPVRAGNTVRIQVKQTSTDYQYFSFYPCAGNV